VSAATATRTARPPIRTVELILAHSHLRLGLLSLARVELETMAGMGLLDTPGLVDLAEVRWRTGDLLGAGEAASVALGEDPSHPLALVIAAEAAAALGRPNEARRLADRAKANATGGIDAVFAGMPRSNVWPPDAAEPPPTAPTLFDREPEGILSPDQSVGTGHERPPTERTRPPAPAVPVTIGLWDDESLAEPAATPLPDPALALEAGRSALVAGALEEAAFHFGLALRLAPALAPAILEATDGARSSSLTMVRGDAYRLAGHESEARQAYAIAAQGGLPERRSRARTVSGPLGADDGAAGDAADGSTGDGPAETTTEAAVDADEADAADRAPADAATTEPTDA
jgi:hypothetical protein